MIVFSILIISIATFKNNNVLKIIFSILLLLNILSMNFMYNSFFDDNIWITAENERIHSGIAYYILTIVSILCFILSIVQTVLTRIIKKRKNNKKIVNSVQQ